MSLRLSSSLAAAFFLLAAIPGECRDILTVAAAADLSRLEPELAQRFEKTNPGTEVRFVTGASAMLAQQIENGAPYDIFMSANSQFIDHLASLRKLDQETVFVYAKGHLGLLWKDGKSHPMKDLAESTIRVVALPNPKLAPYGVAAQQALERLGIWNAMKDKVVYGENVRQTLQLFDSGNADAVLTASSLMTDRHPQVVPENQYEPLLQKAGLVSNTQNRKVALLFLEFLKSPSARELFAKYGFGAATP